MPSVLGDAARFERAFGNGGGRAGRPSCYPFGMGAGLFEVSAAALGDRDGPLMVNRLERWTLRSGGPFAAVKSLLWVTP